MQLTIKKLGIVAMLSAMTAVPARPDGWTKWSPLAAPTGTAESPIVYDSGRAEILFTALGLPTISTWVWDGQTWNLRAPVNAPLARGEQAMAYDAATGQTVLFGGVGVESNVFGDTWTWDGFNWTQQNPANSPSARAGAMMVYDPLHQRVVLFGGASTSANLNDTWTWDGSNWTQQHPTNNPSVRAAGMITYDSGHNQVVLFGGDGASVLNDTWVWDGSNWTQILPQLPPPAGRAGAAMAYDPGSSRVVLFGGTLDPTTGGGLTDTWEWDGANWTQPTLQGSAPSGRFFISMAYDAAHNYLVMFGGGTGSGQSQSTLADTWTFGGLGATLFNTGGNPESTPAGQAFPSPLQVTAVTPAADPESPGSYVAGTSVTFSGPSQFVQLPPNAAVTDSNGRAMVSATATSKPGSYTVTASGSGGSTTFTLSNVNTAAATGACVVTTSADDNSTGSLRFQAAACGKGGTITFAPGLTTVYVTQRQDIQITEDLTIDGGQGINAAINAGQQSRIFFVSGGNVTLKNLTLENGLARGGNGGNAQYAGGGGAGMGGALFISGGSVVTYQVNFVLNEALGGSGGDTPVDNFVAGGGGTGSDAIGVNTTGAGNGGGGGDMGGEGGIAASAFSQNPSENGGVGGGSADEGLAGFGGGGGGAGNGGFGGGAGTPNSTTTVEPGAFGGVGWSVLSGLAQGSGGGAGMGGAIFVNGGTLSVLSSSFSTNSAVGGLGGGGDVSPAASLGQGKGGALFVNSGATALFFQPFPNSFTGDEADDSGSGTSCSIVVGAAALDTADVCGVWMQARASNITGDLQSAAVNSTFTVPLSLTITLNGVPVPGIPITFGSTPGGPALNPPSTTVVTNSSGVASINAAANGVAGSYSVDAEVGGAVTGSLWTYSLTNTSSGPTNVTSEVKVTSSGLIYSRVTQGWSANVTVQNTSGSPLAGPLEVVFGNLTAGVTMVSPSGTYQGSPYMTIAGPLAAGASTSFPVAFSASPSTQITYSTTVYEGSLQ